MLPARALLGLLASGALVGACSEAPSSPGGGSAGTGSQAAGGGGAGNASAGSSTSGTAPGTSGSSSTGGDNTATGGGNGGSAGSIAAGGGGAGGGSVDDGFVVHADFEAATPGGYTEAMVAADFGAEPPWNDGLDEGRVAIVSEGDNQFLRVTYPAGQYGPANGGVQFKIPFAQSYDELFFSYKVRFAEGFTFVKGGKLPGLVGGTSPTGCRPDPDGFSARNMWRGGGAIVQYVYWPDQPNTCGDDLDYLMGDGEVRFEPGTWQTVEHRVKINTPGMPDGVLEGWVDGELRLSESDRLWRSTGATYAIDTLYFSTFFGGSDASWAPSSPQITDFDDLTVSTEPLTH